MDGMDKALARVRYKHPWKRAMRLSVLWGEWQAAMIAFVFGLLAYFIAGMIGLDVRGQATVGALALAVVGVGDLIRVRYALEIESHEKANADSLLRIEKLENAIYAFQSPDELSLFIEEEISASYREVGPFDEEAQSWRYTHAVVYLVGLTITNREDQPVTLDCTAGLQLVRPGPDKKRERAIADLWEGDVVDLSQCHQGVIKIPPHDTMEVTKVLMVNALDGMFIKHCGLKDDGSHVLRFFDRNSGKMTRRHFSLWIYKPAPDCPGDAAVGFGS